MLQCVFLVQGSEYVFIKHGEVIKQASLLYRPETMVKD